MFSIYGMRQKLFSQMIISVTLSFTGNDPYQGAVLLVGMQDKCLCQTKLGRDKKGTEHLTIP